MSAAPPAAEGGKRPFDVGRAVRRIRKAVAGYPPAAMFALADAGYGTLFQQLVGCVLSIRTRDEVSLPASIRLLSAAPTPAALAGLSAKAIDRLIGDVAFHAPKAAQIRDIARRALEDHAGELPCDEAVLTSLRGVGPKCAHLALGIACGAPVIAVDVHEPLDGHRAEPRGCGMHSGGGVPEMKL